MFFIPRPERTKRVSVKIRIVCSANVCKVTAVIADRIRQNRTTLNYYENYKENKNKKNDLTSPETDPRENQWSGRVNKTETLEDFEKKFTIYCSLLINDWKLN